MGLCVEALDPIHYDEAAARARGYRGIVAPWPLLWLAFFNCRDAPLKFDFGRATIHGGDSYEFHEPMVVGDTLTVRATVTSTAVKQGKAGPMGVIVTRREFHNQHGQLCAILDTTNIRR
jgi:acyl dehydratase